MADIVITLIRSGDKVLVIRRSKSSDKTGQWEFPAGHREEGEGDLGAALREVYEETGLKPALYPTTHEFPLKADPKKTGKIFYSVLVGPEPEIVLNPAEHDQYEWVTLCELKDKEPVPPDFMKNTLILLRKNKVLKPNRSTKTARSLPPRTMRVIPAEGEKLENAILVGDSVDIFLRGIADDEKPKLSDLTGIVERRGRNVFWIRDPENPLTGQIPIRWGDEGQWSFIRVMRGKETIYFQKGNPLDPDDKTVSDAKGLGLILEGPPSNALDSVFKLMEGRTPDLDYSLGQAPQTLDVVAPSSARNVLLKQVRQILQDNYLEPHMVDDVGKGRVMILTQDKTLAREIKRLLEKHGKEVTAGRTGSLLVQNKVRKTASQPMKVTIPDPMKQVQEMETSLGQKGKPSPEGLEFDLKDPTQLQNLMGQSPAGMPSY